MTKHTWEKVKHNKTNIFFSEFGNIIKHGTFAEGWKYHNDTETK